MSVDRPVDDAGLRAFAGYGIKRAFNAIQAEVNALLAAHGLRLLSFSALVIVRDNPGLSQGALADALAVERPNMVALIDGLRRNGWLDRARAEGDRRAYALTLTSHGAARLDRAVEALREHDAALTGWMGEGRGDFVDALRRMEEGTCDTPPTP